MKIILLLAFTTLIVSTPAARAENWPHWRGPAMNGSTTESDLPARFSPTENVKWVLDMPGASAAVPIVWGDRVFLTSVDEAKGELVAWCVDRKDGKTLWRNAVAKGERKDDRSNYAAPSPVTDGKKVVYFYGSGPLVAFDFEGKELWSRDLVKDYGEFAFGWTFSSSPMIWNGKVYMQILQRDVAANGYGKPTGNESFLVAFDLETGKELWKQQRPSKAVMESREAFTSPVMHEVNGRLELLVVGGDCLTGHDPETGAERWRWGTWNPDREPFWRLVPSPVSGGGVVLACAPKKNPVYAINAGAEGVLRDSEIAWVSSDKEISSDVPTPLFYEGRFYILNGDRRALSCVEPKTGKVIWSENLDGFVKKGAKIETSPTGADGKIYFMNMLGHVFVVEAGDRFKMLHNVAMGTAEERFARSSISAAQGNLFIRTDYKLYCIGD